MAAEAWREAAGVTVLEAEPPEHESGPPAPGGIYSRLESDGYRFDFYEAVRLLEDLYPDAPAIGETPLLGAERVRIRPNPSLAFPASDVHRVAFSDAERSRAEVVVNFMGLYGVSSPLPEFIRERIALGQDESVPLRDFLDIFNHRLYSLFYRAWKKFRPEVESRKALPEGASSRFLSLAGLGTPKMLDGAPAPVDRLRYLAGRLSGRSRNAEGLHRLVGLMLGVPVAIIENVPQWVRVHVRPALGKPNFALGTSATVGERVYDESGKFRIQIGPIGISEFVSFLPGAKGARLLDWLVKLYAPDYLNYDVELRLRADEARPARLGNDTCKLGLTTFLGRPQTELVSRTVAYA